MLRRMSAESSSKKKMSSILMSTTTSESNSTSKYNDEEDDDNDTNDYSDNDDESKPRTSTTTTATTMAMMMSKRTHRIRVLAYVLLGLVVVTILVLSLRSRTSFPWTLLAIGSSDEPSLRDGVMVQEDYYVNYNNKNKKGKQDHPHEVVPPELLRYGIYKESDFINERGIRPAFWAEVGNNTNTNSNSNSNSNSNTEGSWGPCYPEKNPVEWKRKRSEELVYRHDDRGYNFKSVTGGCRPGFIIIGAGKCGTSSLYHYLVGHPRVVPAYAKQIHYFKYNLYKGLGWYYAWFPTTTTFLQSGALMTGEASPGYIPYPDVAHEMSRLLPGPKLIMLGRNPLSRIYSSYRYNYVQPTLEALRRSSSTSKSSSSKFASAITTTTSTSQEGRPLTEEEIDASNMNRLFSLEDFVRSELEQLEKCLQGFGINATRKLWYKKNWTTAEFDKRDAQGLDPLIDLDAVCYGPVINSTVMRAQWAELQMANPHKVILSSQAFLVQAMIGRSLYTLPLEWYYIVYKPEDIIFVCTEDLSKPEVLNDVALRLGLPSYDFTDIIAQGAYNVGDHRGYDKATSWQELVEESSNNNNNNKNDDNNNDNNNNTTVPSSLLLSDDDDIPLSAELRQELEDFIRPYNERLFQLVGKRCDW